MRKSHEGEYHEVRDKERKGVGMLNAFVEKKYKLINSLRGRARR